MNNSNPVLLVVEGVDCVGKTTLAKSIASALDFHYLYTPQPPLAIIRKEVEILRDPNTRFFYYLASVVAVQSKLREYVARGKNVVIDRYIHSTLVMHYMLGVDVSCVNVKKLPILWPNVSVLLTARPETRFRRRSARDGNQNYDKEIEQSTDLLSCAQSCFLGAHDWSLVLETDNLSLEQVEAEVVKLFPKR